MRLTLGLRFLFISLLFISLLILDNKSTSASNVNEDSESFMMVETPKHDKIPDFLLVEKPDGKTSLIEIDADEGNQTILDRSIAQTPGFCTKCVKDKKYKEYFQIQCTDFNKYLKCQSKCVSSKSNAVKTAFECIRNPACARKCESNCKKVWPASITYDAYCGMMDYVQESPRLNPYDDEDTIKKWIAMLYLARKEKGLIGKDCAKPLINSQITSRAPSYPFRLTASSYEGTEFDGFDDDVPIWDITTEQLEEAYKTVAMTRQIPWTTDLTYEQPINKCVPWFKREVTAGSFPRRNTWLLLEDGCQHRAYLFAKHLTQYMNNKFPRKKFQSPHKHFLFGMFHFESPNAKNVEGVGAGVDWSYHVAPTVRIRNPNSGNQDTLWILDPALFSKPLSKEDYHLKFNEDGRIDGYVTCESNTYGSGDLCINALSNEDPDKPFAVSYFDGELLNAEWKLQKAKNRNPKQVLGNKWKTNNYYVFRE